ncbi:MAG: rod shape-determining protein MreC, partial [Acidimicrobiia bacterium]
EHFATVVPIVGDQSGVTVMVGEQTGTLEPRVGNNLMDLEILEADGPVVQGATVVTAGSANFPPGYPVGEVVVSAQPDGTAVRTLVDPFAEFIGLRVVAVLAWPPAGPVPEPGSASTTSTTTPTDGPAGESASTTTTGSEEDG